MFHRIRIESQSNKEISAKEGSNLLSVLQKEGIFADAPCGGYGTCGKCKVHVNGTEQLACQTMVDQNLIISLDVCSEMKILSEGMNKQKKLNPLRSGYFIALDIGTTTVVCYLLDGRTGETMASVSQLNPQTIYGADVISRIQSALHHGSQLLTKGIRDGITQLITKACEESGISSKAITLISLVGNPAMQQLFLDLSVENLAEIPFSPILTEPKQICAKACLPLCPDADLLVLPDISGFVGADTVACILASEIYKQDDITLLIDIGTNGEMILGNKERMLACSTAAGPALEGANIRFGMRGQKGAIDHVWMEEKQLKFSVIGNGSAKGICGSGLIDAIAVFLENGWINKRGRIQGNEEIDGQRVIQISETVYLTQNDIREVQLAKGAIAAGIHMLMLTMHLSLEQIDHVILAGAFGTYMNAESACRIGMIPEELEDRITAVGNAAGIGAQLAVCDQDLFFMTDTIVKKTEFIELADLPEFRKAFAKGMNLNDSIRI